MKIKVNSSEEIIKLGEQLATSLQAGDVVLLDGELGAGKTTLTKGIAKELGIEKNIKSPTFTLVREYLDGRIPLYHMDMYRLEYSDPFEVGVDEYLSSSGISVIEWSEFISELLPNEYLKLTIVKTGDTSRVVELTAHGKRYQNIMDTVGQK
ncbi:tRNA (adenosine(37)-N6)-threonylcarbamoyltransferase complex ATPase subunit type 1 TsaE [Companilactobacillus sp. RD055328]|uniref:tRNA (adenosine(37)-N6)-threonylcarbamoyltransferase complex ATPase subunit type 1 TsaE n=1 Tax=Companilactobacillus sp. RD055328 TaxID=2916634 RepID=UPI001FC845ED|nr:tRNA (adenosine(37)-N6)-threonylcarbamoyltransferase complex ATPase subunit type 1 TsaE [Companilactobacillus sp. RD055328]GKQ43010.1 tRNA (adenosine(37)-N6)-threonylcarbamoyltransferase complex ATPase subunit type 1 TsaE [Companilactobacillus sp. RD055328]